MTAHIRFQPANADGLVAHGTGLAAAAERLGVRIDLACGGRGECDACAVNVAVGADGLSSVTDAERRMLSEERLAGGDRLACQAHVQDSDCTVRVPEPPAGQSAAPGAAEHEAPPSDDARERVRESFAALPPGEQLAAVLEMQLQVAGDLLNMLVETPMRMGEQLFDSLFGAPPPAEPDPPTRQEPPVNDSREEGPAGEPPPGDRSNEQF